MKAYLTIEEAFFSWAFLTFDCNHLLFDWVYKLWYTFFRKKEKKPYRQCLKVHAIFSYCSFKKNIKGAHAERKRGEITMEKKQKDFSELDDLCFANGWDLQEMIERNDELLKEILAYFIKSGFNLPMMRYALTYLTQCFMNHTSWFIHPDDYYEFCEEHGKEVIRLPRTPGICSSSIKNTLTKLE